MGTLVGVWWWSGEVLVGHWPAFEVKFHRNFSYFWYLNAILPTILQCISHPADIGTCCHHGMVVATVSSYIAIVVIDNRLDDVMS
jgi:hypothetical protein